MWVLLFFCDIEKLCTVFLKEYCLGVISSFIGSYLNCWCNRGTILWRIKKKHFWFLDGIQIGASDA